MGRFASNTSIITPFLFAVNQTSLVDFTESPQAGGKHDHSPRGRGSCLQNRTCIYPTSGSLVNQKLPLWQMFRALIIDLQDFFSLLEEARIEVRKYQSPPPRRAPEMFHVPVVHLLYSWDFNMSLLYMYPPRGAHCVSHIFIWMLQHLYIQLLLQLCSVCVLHGEQQESCEGLRVCGDAQITSSAHVWAAFKT